MRTMCALFLGVAFLASTAWAEEAGVPKSREEKAGYAMGVEMAKSIKQQGVAIEVEALVRGIRDALTDRQPLMTQDEINKAMAAVRNEARHKRSKDVAARAREGEENLKAGTAFLVENKTKEGVVLLPSGLQYKIIKKGEGERPIESDTVEVHYRGSLIDGTEFDSSYRRGESARFKVTGVIPGMAEALKMMPVGSTWQLFIPPELAYGQAGAGPIGPNATLIFDLELLARR